MKRWSSGIGIFLCLIGGVCNLGCDRRPVASSQVPQSATSTSNESEAHPTTQELLLGPQKRLSVPGMPLSVQVPQSWKIQSSGPFTLLTGPTPAGSAAIQLVQRKPIQSDRLATFIDSLKAEDDQPLKAPDLRQVGRAKVLERVAVATIPKFDDHNNPVLDAKGNPIMAPTPLMSWRVAVFVPQGATFDHYELNLMGFGRDQYDADKNLLEGILNSLAYDESAPTMPPAVGKPN